METARQTQRLQGVIQTKSSATIMETEKDIEISRESQNHKTAKARKSQNQTTKVTLQKSQTSAHIKTRKVKFSGGQGTKGHQVTTIHQTAAGTAEVDDFAVSRTRLQEVRESFRYASSGIVAQNRSIGWMRTVRRFLPVVCLEPERRLQCLLTLKRVHGWTWNTLKTYHGAILAALQILNHERTLFDKEAAAFLDKKAVEEIPSVPSALSVHDAGKNFSDKLRKHAIPKFATS